MNSMDRVIEAFKQEVDRTLLRENLELTPGQWVQESMEILRAIEGFERPGDLQAPDA